MFKMKHLNKENVDENFTSTSSQGSKALLALACPWERRWGSRGGPGFWVLLFLSGHPGDLVTLVLWGWFDVAESDDTPACVHF